MKNSVRRGLFHPDDIKTLGLASTGPGPLSAPLPKLARTSSRPALSPITAPAAASFGPASATSPHINQPRSASLAGPLGSGGSFGRAEARRLHNQTEFGKYTEDDEEDYEDVFGKLNGTGESYALVHRRCRLTAILATEHPMQTLQLNTRLSNKSWVRFSKY